MVKALERVCSNAPKCSAVVFPLPVSSDHNSLLGPAHQPNRRQNNKWWCPNGSSHCTEWNYHSANLCQLLQCPECLLRWCLQFLTSFWNYRHVERTENWSLKPEDETAKAASVTTLFTASANLASTTVAVGALFTFWMSPPWFQLDFAHHWPGCQPVVEAKTPLYLWAWGLCVCVCCTVREEQTYH